MGHEPFTPTLCGSGASAHRLRPDGRLEGSVLDPVRFHALLAEATGDHPWPDVQADYVVCGGSQDLSLAAAAERARESGHRIHCFAGSHYPMFTMPKRLADLLHALIQR
jgi:hypothetical protein